MATISNIKIGNTTYDVSAKYDINGNIITDTYYPKSNPNGFTSNTGTVTSVGVKLNGVTKGTVTTSGTIDLGTVLTSHQDISGKVNKSGDTMTGTLKAPNIEVSGTITGNLTATSVSSQSINLTAADSSITFDKGSFSITANDDAAQTVTMAFGSNDTLVIPQNIIGSIPNSSKQIGASDVYFVVKEAGGPVKAILSTGVATQTWVNNKGYTTNTGTVTSVGVKMNGAVKGTVTTSGTIDLGTVGTGVTWRQW